MNPYNNQNYTREDIDVILNTLQYTKNGYENAVLYVFVLRVQLFNAEDELEGSISFSHTAFSIFKTNRSVNLCELKSIQEHHPQHGKQATNQAGCGIPDAASNSL